MDVCTVFVLKLVGFVCVVLTRKLKAYRHDVFFFTLSILTITRNKSL